MNKILNIISLWSLKSKNLLIFKKKKKKDWPQPKDGALWLFLGFLQAFLESLLQLFLALVLEAWFLDTCKIYIFLLFYFYIRSMLLCRALTCNKICELNSMALKTLIFAMPKERDESESCSSQSCIEAQMHLENNDGSRDPDVEVSSITLSEAYLS